MILRKSVAKPAKFMNAYNEEVTLFCDNKKKITRFSNGW